jgi:hypothetical protein
VLLHRAGEHETAIGLPDQGKVKAERAVGQKVLLCLGARPLQDLVPVGKPAEALDHREMPVEDLVKRVQRIGRGQLVHHAVPLPHAQMLILHRFGVG